MCSYSVECFKRILLVNVLYMCSLGSNLLFNAALSLGGPMGSALNESTPTLWQLG